MEIRNSSYTLTIHIIVTKTSFFDIRSFFCEYVQKKEKIAYILWNVLERTIVAYFALF